MGNQGALVRWFRDISPLPIAELPNLRSPETKPNLRAPTLPLHLLLALIFFLLLTDFGLGLGPAYGGDVKYVYDELGRLVQVIDVQSGNSATYHYDAVGNLLSITTN